MATTTAKPSSSPPWFLISILGVVVLGFLAIAFFATQGGDETTASDIPIGTDIDATAPVTVEGDALPTVEGAAVFGDTSDPAVGLTAPTITGTDFSGEEITIAPDGRPKVVYFLAHWCSHCNNEVPQIVDLLEEGSKPDGVDIYAVSTAVLEDQANYPPNNWLSFGGWTEPVMRDSETQEALVSFGAGGFPYAVYLDGDHTVISRSAGEMGKDAILESWNIVADVAASTAS